MKKKIWFTKKLRWMSAVLSVVMIFSFASCADTDKEQGKDAGEENTVQNQTNEIKSEKGEIITDTNAGYEIELLNGKYYIVFEDEKYKNNVNTSQEEPYLTFSSVAEMKSKLLSGKLTEEELKTMSMFRKDNAGRIKIPNLEQLCVPLAPENVVCLDRVGWSGGDDRYTIGLSSDDCSISLFEVQSEERYTYCLKKTIDMVYNNELVTIIETVQTNERDATICLHTTSVGEFKRIEYTIVTDEGEIFVAENYRLKTIYPTEQVSDVIPYRVELYGDFGDRYFYCSIYELTERPTVEWLSSFGLAEVT